MSLTTLRHYDITTVRQYDSTTLRHYDTRVATVVGQSVSVRSGSFVWTLMSGPVCPGTVSTGTVQTPVRPDGGGELIL